jgi:hypothetical protein
MRLFGPSSDPQLVAVGWKRDEMSPPARTEVVDTDIGRDPSEPGADLEASVEPVQGLERPEKGLLRGFLRVVEITEHPAADAVTLARCR